MPATLVDGHLTLLLIENGMLSWESLNGVRLDHPEHGHGKITEVRIRARLTPLLDFSNETETFALDPFLALKAPGAKLSLDSSQIPGLEEFQNVEDPAAQRVAIQNALKKADRERHESDIREFCVSRRITRLYHYTPLENINLILSRGLVARSQLDPSTAVFTDPERLDGQLDYISVSIGFPNYRTFFKKRNELNVEGWAIISIDPSALSRLGCLFIPTNAASAEGQAIARANPSSLASLKELFADADSRAGLPAGYPTNPQAEVLFRRHLPSCYFREVIVKDEKTKKTIQARVQNFPVRVNAELFKYRQDWEHWTTPRL